MSWNSEQEGSRSRSKKKQNKTQPVSLPHHTSSLLRTSLNSRLILWTAMLAMAVCWTAAASKQVPGPLSLSRSLSRSLPLSGVCLYGGGGGGGGPARCFFFYFPGPPFPSPPPALARLSPRALAPCGGGCSGGGGGGGCLLGAFSYSYGALLSLSPSTASHLRGSSPSPSTAFLPSGHCTASASPEHTTTHSAVKMR